jgi:hypothetical protein
MKEEGMEGEREREIRYAHCLFLVNYSITDDLEISQEKKKIIISLFFNCTFQLSAAPP